MGKTRIFCILGDPIAHSLSPAMHNAALTAMDVDAVYVPFRVAPDVLGEAVAGLRALNISGFNVTVPHKTAVMEFLDHISDEARAIGAVNTIVNTSEGLFGHNTDAWGFRAALTHAGVDEVPSRVCVLGAGGAARAVVYACAWEPGVVEVQVVNRTLANAERLVSELVSHVPVPFTAHPADEATLRRIVPVSDLVVNTTSVGMHPNVDDTPVGDASLFHDGQVVCDIVYAPVETRFLQDAASRGARTVGGLGMLACQGARALSLWLNQDIPPDAMLHALTTELGLDTGRRDG